MEHRLTYPHPLPHFAFDVVQKVIEWAAAILLMVAASPVLIRAGMYLLTRLYEVLIQYQYLF